MKLQRLQNTVTGNFPMRTSTRELYAAFNIPYDFITRLCRQSKQTQFETTKMHIFATQVYARPHTGSMRPTIVPACTVSF